MALYEDVAKGAQAQVQEQGRTIGDALQAYHAAATLENSRKELEMQKQNNEISKATAFIGQLKTVAALPPASQKIAINNLSNGPWRQMYPAMSEDFHTAMKTDNDFRAKALQFGALEQQNIASGKPPTLEGAQALSTSFDNLGDAQNLIGKRIEDHSKERQAALSSQAKDTKAATALSSREQMQAQRQWNTEFSSAKPITMRIEGANRILHLVKDAENGKFKTNRAFLGQLNAEVSRLETGAQNPGLGQAEKTEMESASAELGAIKDKYFNGISDVDLRAQAKQAKGMVSSLLNGYVQMGNRKAEELKAGATESQLSVFDKKHQSFADHYGNGNSAEDTAPAPADYTQNIKKALAAGKSEAAIANSLTKRGVTDAAGAIAKAKAAK